MRHRHAKAVYRYHHIGILTTIERPGETFIAVDGVYASGYFESPFAIEWLRFTADSPLPALIREQPHVAFVVEDLDSAIQRRELLLALRSPAPGVRVAFIVDNGRRSNWSSSNAPNMRYGPTRARCSRQTLRIRATGARVDAPGPCGRRGRAQLRNPAGRCWFTRTRVGGAINQA